MVTFIIRKVPGSGSSQQYITFPVCPVQLTEFCKAAFLNLPPVGILLNFIPCSPWIIFFFPKSSPRKAENGLQKKYNNIAYLIPKRCYYLINNNAQFAIILIQEHMLQLYNYVLSLSLLCCEQIFSLG